MEGTGNFSTKFDPRFYQIAALVLLLLYGLVWLEFDLPALQAVILLSAVVATQFLCTRLWQQSIFDPKSALISGLSLCLLLRTNSFLLATLAATIAIVSKFALRWNGKHLFNPTNLALIVMLLCAPGGVWVSPGQWGAATVFAFLMVCLGGLVVNRAARADVSLSFLAFYVALLFGRSLWLGEPMTIPIHRLENGALLLFAFFMISDPKTTPNSRAGRIVFALLVALGAAYVQFRLFRTNGLLWSLAVCSLAVPVIDHLLPGERYRWRRAATQPLPLITHPNKKGTPYEPALG